MRLGKRKWRPSLNLSSKLHSALKFCQLLCLPLVKKKCPRVSMETRHFQRMPRELESLGDVALHSRHRSSFNETTERREKKKKNRQRDHSRLTLSENDAPVECASSFQKIITTRKKKRSTPNAVSHFQVSRLKNITHKHRRVSFEAPSSNFPSLSKDSVAVCSCHFMSTNIWR